jgi:O-antigen/teichoic acid export membrane protein
MEEYSIYPVMISVMMFVQMLKTILASGIARYTIEAYAKGDNAMITQITSTMLIIQFIGCIVVLLCGILLCWKIDIILNIDTQFIHESQIMIALLFLLFIIQLLAAPFQSGLLVKQKFVLLNLIRTGENFLRIFLLFIFLFAISIKVIWLIVSTFIAGLASTLAQIILSRYYIPSIRFSLKKINWSVSKDLLSFGSWNLLLSLAYQIYTSSDTIILNKLATAFDVTIFYLGSLVQKQLQSVMLTVTQPLFPTLTALYAINHKKKISNTYLRYGRYYCWIFMSIIVPVIAYKHELISLYLGEKFFPAGTVMLLLLSSMAVIIGNDMTFKLASAQGKLKSLAIRSSILQCLNLGLSIYFVGILKMGALGSALATFIITVFLTPFLEIPLGLKLAGLNFKRYFKEIILPGYIPGIITYLILIGFRLIKKPDALPWLVLYVSIGYLAYFIILFVFSLQPTDRQDLNKAGARLKKVLKIFKADND